MTKAGIAKRLRKLALILCAVAGAWYLLGRIASPWMAVNVIHLPDAVRVVDADSVRRLKVGCYNIAHGRGGEYGRKSWQGGGRSEKQERVRRIAQFIKKADLDVLVLNEVDFSAAWSGHFNQARLIAEEAGFPYLVEQRNRDASIPFCAMKSGNAVLSKYPLSAASRIEFPALSTLERLTHGHHRGAICALELPNGQQLQIGAVHMEWRSETIRVASARMLIAIAGATQSSLIALGDFNSTPTGYPHSESDDKGANAMDLLYRSEPFGTSTPAKRPAQAELTFPSESPDRVIDWILPTAPWRIVEQQVLQSDLSDHLPVVAILEQR